MLMASCRTTKTSVDHKATSNTEINASEQVKLDISTQKGETTLEEKNLNVTSTGETDTEVDETITNTKWSAPDSLGNQHIIEQTQINRNTKTKAKAKTATTEEEKKQKEETESTQDNSTLEADYNLNAEDATETQETTSSKSESPAWMNWLIICVIAAALIVVLLVLKRYNIIKW